MKVCFMCKTLTHDRNIFPLRIHAEDQAVALEEGPSRMRNSHSQASGKDKGKAVMVEGKEKDSNFGSENIKRPHKDPKKKNINSFSPSTLRFC